MSTTPTYRSAFTTFHKAQELATEQMQRLARFAATRPPEEAYEFYQSTYEIGISNQIARLMANLDTLNGHLIHIECAIPEIPV